MFEILLDVKTEEWIVEPRGDEFFTAIRLHPSEPLLVIGTDTRKLILYNLRYREIVHEIQNFEETPFGDRVLIVAPVRDLFVDGNNNLIYLFMHNGVYKVNLIGFDIESSIPIDEEVIAGTVSYEYQRLAYLTKSGLVSVWKLGIEFNVGDYQLDPPMHTCKLSILNEEEVVVSSQDGTVTSINLKKKSHKSLHDFSQISYLIDSYYYDDNDDFYVSLTQDGSVRVIQRISSNEIKSVKSLSTYFADTQEPRKSLRQVISSSKKIMNPIVFLSDLSEEMGFGEEIVTKSNRINRVSKDRYEVLAQDIEKSKDEKSRDAEIKELVTGDSPELTLAQAVETYVTYKNAKTRDVLRKVCMMQGLDPKMAVFSWRLNQKRSSGLIALTNRMTAMRSARTQKKYLVISLAILILILNVLFYSFGPRVQQWLILYLGMSTTSLLLLLLLNRINQDPRIPFIPDFRMFWNFGMVMNTVLLVFQILEILNIIIL